VGNVNRKVCRYYRTAKLIGGGPGGGDTTCELGLSYAALLPTPEAGGSGWVRRLPCVQLGTMPRLEGGLPCPHYVELTPEEDFARFEPLRRIGERLNDLRPADIRRMNGDKAETAAFMAEHGKPKPGVATLVETATHVALLCACGERTDVPRVRPEGEPMRCSSCGAGYALRFVQGRGDHVLECC
jgi:hypothetical protein